MHKFEINDTKEYDKIIQEQKMTIVYFTAGWCGPCKKISPFFETCSEKYKQILFLKVDVDTNPDICTYLQIETMPTFRFYKCGKPIAEFQGASEIKLQAAIDHLIHINMDI